MSAEQVDQLIASQEQHLLNSVRIAAQSDIELIPPETPAQNPKSRIKAKAAKASPLDKVLENLKDQLGKE
jgi:hypothetical protein